MLTTRSGNEYRTHRVWWSLLEYATIAALTILVLLVLRA